METFALSVDYGTSNTVALLRWPDGRIRPLLFDGSPLLSSAVYAESNDHLLVGRDALHSARLEPAKFEPNPKRCIDELNVLLGEHEFPVTDLVAAVLRRVADEARQVTGGAPLSVVMTHPAEWGAARRTVLTDAAAAVGWDTPTLVPEPVAAATYFGATLGHQIPPGSCVVVYDLGAGTFDASVVRRDTDGYHTLACRGLDDVGGVDFDEAIVGVLGRAFEVSAPAEWKRLVSPQSVTDRRHARALRDDARLAKERLSRSSGVTVLVPLLDREGAIGREEFDAAVRPLIARTTEVTAATIRAARIDREQIAGVFLVGGSTRVPLVATELHRALELAPIVLEQPEIVVAEGALHNAVSVQRAMPQPAGAVTASPPAAQTDAVRAPAVRTPAVQAPAVQTPAAAPVPPAAPTAVAPSATLGGGGAAGPVDAPRQRLVRARAWQAAAGVVTVLAIVVAALVWRQLSTPDGNRPNVDSTDDAAAYSRFLGYFTDTVGSTCEKEDPYSAEMLAGATCGEARIALFTSVDIAHAETTRAVGTVVSTGDCRSGPERDTMRQESWSSAGYSGTLYCTTAVNGDRGTEYHIEWNGSIPLRATYNSDANATPADYSRLYDAVQSTINNLR